MDCNTAESDLPLTQAERTEDGEEPPLLLHFNAACGCVLSPRTQITIEIGPQPGTIQLPLLRYRLIHTFSRSRSKAQSGPQSAFKPLDGSTERSTARLSSPKSERSRRRLAKVCGLAGAICDLLIWNHAQRSCGMIVHPRVLFVFAITNIAVQVIGHRATVRGHTAGEAGDHDPDWWPFSILKIHLAPDGSGACPEPAEGIRRERSGRDLASNT
jgi:hypothetical protein